MLVLSVSDVTMDLILLLAPIVILKKVKRDSVFRLTCQLGGETPVLLYIPTLLGFNDVRGAIPARTDFHSKYEPEQDT